MINVYTSPLASAANRDATNGINQIVVHLDKYLPALGFQHTEDAHAADLFSRHAGGDSGNVDVAFCHGLYPTGVKNFEADGWMWSINSRVIADLKSAYEVIVPSQWVADIIRRDMHLEPHVIGWGVEWDYWQTEFDPIPGQYVLWNKNRESDVCDPAPMNALAKLASEYNFVSTFGKDARNVHVVGNQSFADMTRLIKSAYLYLATTKETFGIGTLEALAAGLPVVGWNWGGTADIIQHGVNGFLAEPGDIDGLYQGLQYCNEHYAVLSENARKTAQAYDWAEIAAKIANVYQITLEQKKREIDGSIQVSVVIPNHNYKHYIQQAIESVLEQQTNFPFELIVVDDGSTDGSLEFIRNLLEDKAPDIPVTILHHENAGVSFTRNRGIEQAQGRFVVCMDADDAMKQGFLQVCFDVLSKDRTVGIAYTRLEVMGGKVSAWPNEYDYAKQTVGNNQIPSLCMFRKDAWERAGGFRQRYAPSEDGEFWLRILSYGFTAKKASDQPLFLYRMHEASASAAIRRGEASELNWTLDKQWVHTGQHPFASDAKSMQASHPVRNYDTPIVSVIIPVGPYHTEIFRDAVDSVEGQAFLEWEIILVNDSGELLNLRGMPFVKCYDVNFRSAAKSRNFGVAKAKGEFVVFLDADDLLLRDFMRKTVEKFRSTGRYIFTNWMQWTKQGNLEEGKANPDASLQIFWREFGHINCTLLPRQWFAAVGGFDEFMESWEDVDLYMKLVANGYCGAHLDESLMLYDYRKGELRERGQRRLAEYKQLIKDRYKQWIDGGEDVCCGKTMAKPEQTPELNDGNAVKILYDGPGANHRVSGPATGRAYGRRKAGDVFYVFAEDQKADPERFVITGNFTTSQEVEYAKDIPQPI